MKTGLFRQEKNIKRHHKEEIKGIKQVLLNSLDPPHPTPLRRIESQLKEREKKVEEFIRFCERDIQNDVKLFILESTRGE